MLSVTHKSLMLGVIRLNVIMLSVVAPSTDLFFHIAIFYLVLHLKNFFSFITNVPNKLECLSPAGHKMFVNMTGTYSGEETLRCYTLG
jgi:hypothetical protein